MSKKMIAVLLGASLTAGVLGLGAGGAFAGDKAGATGTPGTTGAITTEAAAPRPPKGARAVVQVSPNPTVKRGEEVTITGHCGGGKKLNAVLSGFSGRPVLKNIRIIDDNPDGFVAKATLSREIGNGVGPVFVDCGGEAGVTLLVTHV
ncbi:hypothetical protein [Streptosporangium roseum]|uniref:Secreted protein n=1 Tax=Streptosporangium roseum (strain ATCC 12428 / DSM 43021 / JCM 3005 / KCTC 9067 / NCIMB 10171 / NRRL 2505 / NI 9100) TaxID=479432 RepID=D2AXX5_STRRD|nr:hypothetical protein [Streptosporangium roseum]ACZ85146.1 hypothetical protein Sros_2163 [Streptosporangium roseum DSM 43021]